MMARSNQVRRSVAFPDSTIGPWKLEIELGAVSGRVECVGLEVKPLRRPSSEPLTVTTIREMPLHSLMQEQRLESSDDFLKLVGIELPAKVGSLGDAGLGILGIERPRQAGRPEVALDDIEKAAKVYLAAPTAPRKAVAKELGIGESTAAKWIQRARKLGLISPTTPGKRSGRPDR